MLSVKPQTGLKLIDGGYMELTEKDKEYVASGRIRNRQKKLNYTILIIGAILAFFVSCSLEGWIGILFLVPLFLAFCITIVIKNKSKKLVNIEKNNVIISNLTISDIKRISYCRVFRENIKRIITQWTCEIGCMLTAWILVRIDNSNEQYALLFIAIGFLIILWETK
jgi:hypothetical protein